MPKINKSKPIGGDGVDWGHNESETLAVGWRKRLVNDSTLTESLRRTLIGLDKLYLLDVILYDTEGLAKVDSDVLGWLGNELGLGDKIEFVLEYDPRMRR